MLEVIVQVILAIVCMLFGGALATKETERIRNLNLEKDNTFDVMDRYLQFDSIIYSIISNQVNLYSILHPEEIKSSIETNFSDKTIIKDIASLVRANISENIIDIIKLYHNIREDENEEKDLQLFILNKTIIYIFQYYSSIPNEEIE